MTTTPISATPAPAHGSHVERIDEGTDDALRLEAAMSTAARVMRTVGADRIEIVTLTRGRICLQPVDLNEGEQIARTLGCDFPLDHRMFVPGHTLWAGQVEGLEVQVRSVLRQQMAVTP
jgi:hypothetical protein